MACCILTAYIMNRIIKSLEVLDLKLIKIQYNDFDDPNSLTDKLSHSACTVRVRIGGMTCTACVTQIEHALVKVDGVIRVSVSLQLNRATVHYDVERVSPLDIELAIRGAGYDAIIGDRTADENLESLTQSKQLKKLRSAFSSAAITSGFVVAVDMIRLSLPLEFDVKYGITFFVGNIFLTTWVQFIDARWIHQNAWKWTGRGFSANMDTLISLSLILGILLSFFNISLHGWRVAQNYFATGCFLTMVITAGRYLDLALKKSGTSNFTKLYQLQLETTLVQLRSNKTRIPASLLRKNEEIILEPMTIIPCDCYVVEGSTSVDESTMTGESFPATKVIGDFLLSGTKNLSRRVVAVVSAEQKDSSLERMIESISTATEDSSHERSYLDKITSHFVITIIVLAFLSFAYSFLRSQGVLLDRINIAAQRAMAVLAAACPCALGLAIPSATMAGIDAAWERGVLITGGKKALNALSSATHMVMDKTGTLTEGHLQVAAYYLNYGTDKILCQRLLYLAERDVAQSHPVGKAIFQWALQQLEGVLQSMHGDSQVVNHQDTPGKGVSCVVLDLDGTSHEIHVGSESFLQDSGISCELPEQSDESFDSIAVHFSINRKHIGYLILREKIRKEAPSVICKLKAMGLDVTMLTGDSKETATQVSSTLGIQVLSFRSLPHEKQACVRSIQLKGGKVAMIGDGMNDSLAQAAADVGILLSLNRNSMVGATGVIIMSPCLGALPVVISIAKFAVNQAMWNVRWAIGYNMISVSLAFGVFQQWGYVIDVSVAGALMAFSSLLILAMSLHLRRRLSRI